MKVQNLQWLACCTLLINSVLSSSTGPATSTSREVLYELASAQLERLAPYRRIVDRGGSDPPKVHLSQFDPTEKSTTTTTTTTRTADPKTIASSTDEERIALEILEILSKDQHRQADRQAQKFEEDQAAAMMDILRDPRYAAMFQERIKRSESGGIVTGSGSIVSGIASGILGGITSASKGSSSSGEPAGHVVYGAPPVHTYDDKSFDIWDFKKAIFNTLIQAIKAISGGVLALKGQLIKGGGFLISTKGRIISTTGDAISSLGRQIAASAAVAPPKPVYGHSYGYEHPQIEHTYSGPPPSISDYQGTGSSYEAHTSYPSPSDDDDQAGLLIIKPSKSSSSDDDIVQDVDPRRPSLSELEDSFGGSRKGSMESQVVLSPPAPSPVAASQQVVATEDHKDTGHENHVDTSQHVERPQNHGFADQFSYTALKDKGPSSGYGFPYFLEKGRLEQQQQQQIHPDYSLLSSQNSEPGKIELPSIFAPTNPNAHLSIQQSIEYPPLHLQQIEYPITKGQSMGYKDISALELPNFLPQIDSLKIPVLDQDSQELPKIRRPMNFHSALPQFTDVRSIFDATNALKTQELRDQIPTYYWQSQELLQPMASYAAHGTLRRRSTASKRRFPKDLARQTAYYKDARFY